MGQCEVLTSMMLNRNAPSGPSKLNKLSNKGKIKHTKEALGTLSLRVRMKYQCAFFLKSNCEERKKIIISVAVSCRSCLDPRPTAIWVYYCRDLLVRHHATLAPPARRCLQAPLRVAAGQLAGLENLCTCCKCPNPKSRSPAGSRQTCPSFAFCDKRTLRTKNKVLLWI